jgi:signal transduction histidine kinase
VQRASLVRSTGFRLVAWYAAVFGVSVTILLGIVYWIGVSAVEQQLHDSITREMRLLVDVHDTRGLEALERAVNRRTSELTSPRRYYRLQAADGRRLAGNLPRQEPIEAVRVMHVPESEEARKAKADEGAKAASIAAQADSMVAQGIRLSGGEYLLVGENRYRLVKAKEAIVRALGWGAPLTVLLALGGGVLLAINYLRRIDEVNRTLSSIMEGDLGRRVRTRGSGDEMDRLAANLNAMLERIQTLMESVRRVSDDLAHDLRTPLSRLRQRLESARAQGNPAADYGAVIDQSMADLDAILDTFGALLRIAQIESGARRSAFGELDLAVLAASVAESYAPVAEDRGQRLIAAIASEAWVHGDRELLAQMLVNLVENAIQHSAPGASIVLGAGAQDESAVIRVCDTGPGIPAAERANVFRRFYRPETSRSTPGNGLGLALVKAVVDLHAGTVELTDNAPGLCVTVRFPAAAGRLPVTAARDELLAEAR